MMSWGWMWISRLFSVCDCDAEVRDLGFSLARDKAGRAFPAYSAFVASACAGRFWSRRPADLSDRTGHLIR